MTDSSSKYGTLHDVLNPARNDPRMKRKKSWEPLDMSSKQNKKSVEFSKILKTETIIYSSITTPRYVCKHNKPNSKRYTRSMFTALLFSLIRKSLKKTEVPKDRWMGKDVIHTHYSDISKIKILPVGDWRINHMPYMWLTQIQSITTHMVSRVPSEDHPECRVRAQSWAPLGVAPTKHCLLLQQRWN